MLAILMSTALTLTPYMVDGHDKGKTSTLSAAVKEFNQKAQRDVIGKDQPALTEDEVVAAIRGWIRETHPVSDKIYKDYQMIADTKKLPEGTSLKFINGWHGHNNHTFDVWWIDLTIKSEEKFGYSYRIRSQMLRCQKLTK